MIAILLFLILCSVSVSASEQEKCIDGLWDYDRKTVLELGAQFGQLSNQNLAAIRCVNKHFYKFANTFIQERIDYLKDWIARHHDDKRVVYSPDKLSAVFVKAVPNTKRELGSYHKSHRSFDEIIATGEKDEYRVFEWAQMTADGVICRDYLYEPDDPSHDRCVPFFSKNLAFVYLDGRNSLARDDKPVRFACIDTQLSIRSPERFFITYFHLLCPKKGYLSDLWFEEYLPQLRAEVMHTHTVRIGQTIKWTTMLSNTKVTYLYANLTESSLLTAHDIKILHRFTPRGCYANWHYIKNRSVQYDLLNMLRCWGSEICDDLFTRYFNKYLGMKKYNLPGYGTFTLSHVYDEVFFKNTKVLSEKQWTSDFSYATHLFLTHKHNKNLFQKNNWWNETYEERCSNFKKAISFLKNERMVLIPQQEGYLVRYDSLSNTVRMFTCLKVAGCISSRRDKDQIEVHTSDPVKLPRNIDLSTLHVKSDGIICYQVKKLNIDSSSSSSSSVSEPSSSDDEE